MTNMQIQNAEVVKKCKRDIQQYMYSNLIFFLLTLNLIFFLFTSLYHVLFSSKFRSWNQWHSNQRGSHLLKSFLGSCLIRLKSILGWCVVPYSSIIYQPEWQFIRSTPFTTQSKFKQCQFYHRRTTKDLYGVI